MLISLKSALLSRWTAFIFLSACLAWSQAAQSADSVNGIPVIDKLDLQTLERGKIHKFWFKAVDTNTGQSWNVPVNVNRGATDGTRVLLNSGTHGD